MPLYELGIRARCDLARCGQEQTAANRDGLIALNWVILLTKGGGKKPVVETYCCVAHQAEAASERMQQGVLFADDDEAEQTETEAYEEARAVADPQSVS